MQNTSGISNKGVVCLGASIVEGRVSVDFVEMLRQRLGCDGFQFINAGIAGNQSYDVLGRLDAVLAHDPDVVVILVGSNDVTGTLDGSTGRFARWAKRLPQLPSREWYRENMQAVVRRLKGESQARIGLCSIPVMGEDLGSPSNAEAQAFNAILAEIASQEGVTYIPVFERQAKYLRQHDAANGRPLDVKGLMRASMKLLLCRFVLRQTLDDISRRNGRLLTVEGLHMNSVGAGLIADEVEAFLRT